MAAPSTAMVRHPSVPKAARARVARQRLTNIEPGTGIGGPSLLPSSHSGSTLSSAERLTVDQSVRMALLVVLGTTTPAERVASFYTMS